MKTLNTQEKISEIIGRVLIGVPIIYFFVKLISSYIFIKDKDMNIVISLLHLSYFDYIILIMSIILGLEIIFIIYSKIVIRIFFVPTDEEKKLREKIKYIRNNYPNERARLEVKKLRTEYKLQKLNLRLKKMKGGK